LVPDLLAGASVGKTVTDTVASATVGLVGGGLASSSTQTIGAIVVTPTAVAASAGATLIHINTGDHW